MTVQVLKEGYYWPTIRRDARAYTKTCLECQKYGPVFNSPPEEIRQIVTPWPFSRWVWISWDHSQWQEGR